MKNLFYFIICLTVFFGCDQIKNENWNRSIHVSGYQYIYLASDSKITEILINESNCSEFVVTWNKKETKISYFCDDEIFIDERDIIPPR